MTPSQTELAYHPSDRTSTTTLFRPSICSRVGSWTGDPRVQADVAHGPLSAEVLAGDDLLLWDIWGRLGDEL